MAHCGSRALCFFSEPIKEFQVDRSAQDTRLPIAPYATEPLRSPSFVVHRLSRRGCSVSSTTRDLPVELFIAFNHLFYREIPFDPLPAPSPIKALDPVNRFNHFVLGA